MKLPGRSADILVRSKPERIKNSRSSVSQRVDVDCCGQECPRSSLGCGFAALGLCGLMARQRLPSLPNGLSGSGMSKRN